MSLPRIIEALKPEPGLSAVDRSIKAIMRQHLVDRGMMHERDARYDHDDEHAMRNDPAPEKR